jgi:hypothetical protein
VSGGCNPNGPTPAGPVSPLRGAFYVDPLFTGTSTGSQQNPYKSVTAAIAAAAALALAAFTVYLAPGSNTAENVTLPSTGEVDIVGLCSPGNLSACIITGNVTIPATASARRWLRDVQIAGNVLGNTSAGVHRVTFERVSVTGTTTLTVSGAGVVRIGTLGGVPGVNGGGSNMGYCFFTGAVAIQGTIWGGTTGFQSTVSCSGICTFSNCTFAAAITTTAEAATDNQLIFNDCLAPVTINISQSVPGRLALVSGTNTSFDTAAVNFTGVGINVFGMDAITAESFFQHGGTTTGTVLPGTMPRARLTAQVNNIAQTPLTLKCPVPMLRANGTLTLVTPGTLGAAVLNAAYIDSLGIGRVKPITPALNIAGAAGDEVQGSLLFTQNGSTGVSWSVTGIVTPGALSYNLAVSLEPGM